MRSAKRGRAAQMNAGAAAARGEIMSFVHADTRPPSDMVAALREAFRDGKTVVAGFKTSIEGAAPRARVCGRTPYFDI